jgi:hypothetical protein
MNRISIRILFALLAAITIDSCSKDTEPVENTPTPKDFHGIPAYGIGGDSLLNLQKNRWQAPSGYTDMTVSEIMNLQHDLLFGMGAKERRNWTMAATDQAKKGEMLSVRVTAYLIADKEEGNETCNGNNAKYHDYHLWIADSLNHGKDKALIAEAIPFWQEKFPSWLLPIFDTLIAYKSQVRISGRIMWDEDHPDDVAKTRGSLWEIHPMTKFEYNDGSKWTELALSNSLYIRWNYAYIF